MFILLTIVSLTHVCQAHSVNHTKIFKDHGQLTSFYAFNEKSYVLIQWNMAGQEGFSHFVLERSIDGKNFKDVALIFTKEAGDTPDYAFKDKVTVSAGHAMYYRLRMVDNASEVTYSYIRPVRQSNDQQTFVLNNSTNLPAGTKK